jgi:hypothetical protein
VEVGGHIGEVGFVPQVGAESHPRGEETGSVGLCSRHDAASGRFRSRHEFRAESIAVGSGHMRQGLSCGNFALNKVSKSSSERCMLLEMMSAMVLASPLMWETS